jgi:hypothetical protein
MWQRRHVYRVLLGRPEGKRLLGTPRCRCEDCIKMELQAGGWRSMGWIDLAQVRGKGWALVNAVMNIWVP